jgi:hypothetical protein
MRCRAFSGHLPGVALEGWRQETPSAFASIRAASSARYAQSAGERDDVLRVLGSSGDELGGEQEAVVCVRDAKARVVGLGEDAVR